MSARHEEMTLMEACMLGDDVIRQLLIVAVALRDGRRREVDALAQMQPNTPEWAAMIAQLADDSGLSITQ